MLAAQGLDVGYRWTYRFGGAFLPEREGVRGFHGGLNHLLGEGDLRLGCGGDLLSRRCPLRDRRCLAVDEGLEGEVHGDAGISADGPLAVREALGIASGVGIVFARPPVVTGTLARVAELRRSAYLVPEETEAG